MIIFLYLFGALLTALTLTGVLRGYALRKNIIDVPNERSSHTVPTPRGGGVAIVLSTVFYAIVLGLTGYKAWQEVLCFALPGLLVAAIGFLDDHGHIAARWRLLGHFSAAVVALFLLPSSLKIVIFDWQIDSQIVICIFFTLYLVWMLNLYNFMDGIDGLASVQAISVCTSAIIVYMLLGYADLIWLPLILAASVAGFLFWNFPPAKIFMGDAGSGFLGIALGVLSLQAAVSDPQLLWVWLILMGVFITDATVTLIRRLLHGDKVYEAHRSHAYQFASRRWNAHKPVTLVVMVINIIWLLPLALGVGLLGWEGSLVTIAAYLPLILIALKLNAGLKERSV